MYQFAREAKTTTGWGLKQPEFLFSPSGGWKFEMEVSADLVSPEASRRVLWWPFSGRVPGVTSCVHVSSS